MKSLVAILATLVIGTTVLAPTSANALLATGGGASVLIVKVVGSALVLSGVGAGVFAEKTIAGQNFGWLIFAGIILSESETSTLGEIDMASHLADLEASSVYTPKEIAAIQADFTMLQKTDQAIAIDLTALADENGKDLVVSDLLNQGLSAVTADFLLNIQGIQAN